MKKIITIILAACMFTFAFSGCSSSSSTLKDGKYKAIYNAPDDHGWTEYVEITVESEKIKTVTFDSTNSEGTKKSQDESYKQVMLNAGSKTYPAEFYSKLASELVEKQNINEVDDVTGATSSSTSFKKLVKALESNMKSGNTSEVKVNE